LYDLIKTKHYHTIRWFSEEVVKLGVPHSLSCASLKSLLNVRRDSLQGSERRKTYTKTLNTLGKWSEKSSSPCYLWRQTMKPIICEIKNENLESLCLTLWDKQCGIHMFYLIRNIRIIFCSEEFPETKIYHCPWSQAYKAQLLLNNPVKHCASAIQHSWSQRFQLDVETDTETT
jgi:hypothetical protein